MKEQNIYTTSEECVLPEMTGKYDLVFFVSQRARAILNGSPTLIEEFENSKVQSVIMAMEEIRQKKLPFNDMLASLASPYIETAQETSEVRRFEDDEDDDEDDEEATNKLNYKSEEEYED